MASVNEILLNLAMITFVIIIGLGYANKIVIFNDRNDYLRTLILAISCIIFYFLVFSSGEISDATKYFYAPLVGLICIILFIDSIIFSTRHNSGNALLGVLIAVARTFYIFITIVVVAFLLLPSRDKNGRILIIKSLLGVVAAGGVAYLSFMLINGDKVNSIKKGA